MTKKGDRPVARHILIILAENKGRGLRFTDIKRALHAKGWYHVDSSISIKTHQLVEQGKIVCIGNRFGIPNIRPDGSAYITTSDKFGSRTIELGRVKLNA